MKVMALKIKQSISKIKTRKCNRNIPYNRASIKKIRIEKILLLIEEAPIKKIIPTMVVMPRSLTKMKRTNEG
jgi:hypothetical protein